MMEIPSDVSDVESIPSDLNDSESIGYVDADVESTPPDVAIMIMEVPSDLSSDVESLAPDISSSENEEDVDVDFFLQRIFASGQFDRQIGDQILRSRLPSIKHTLNLDRLKANSIYGTLQNATGCSVNLKPKSIVKLLSQRERGAQHKGGSGSFRRAERCGIANNYLPNHSSRLLKYGSKIYCGALSNNGKFFITASQDHVLRIYDASNEKYRRINRIAAKDVNWGILDVAFSSDSEYFVYSTWSTSLHISRTVGGTAEELVTLNLQENTQRFCIFSVAFSQCNRHIIGGSSDGCLYGYDRMANRRTLCVPVDNSEKGVINDVNAVGYLDETSNIIFTGLDDGIIKVWDHRCLDDTRHEPVGILVGHYDGITYIDAKNDGRYLISNSKDQSIKLWDVRMFARSCAEKRTIRYRRGPGDSNWDYRWDNIPKEFCVDESTLMKDDTSIMTYRGHRVKKSLIRAKFSPIESTGQRYVYTGCGTGRLIIYDTLTGQVVRCLEGHSDIVRDIAWHPDRQEVLTSSWDTTVNRNRYIDRSVHFDNNKDRTEIITLKAPRRSRRIANRRANRPE